MRIQFAEKSCIFTLLSTRKRRILEFTVHHTGSTKNIQDLRNFAHFAHETPSEKHKKEPLSYENGSFSKSAPNRNRTCIFSSAGILGSCLFECFIVGETRIVKNVISHVSKKCPFSENGLFSPLWQFGGKACYNLAKVFSEYAVRAVKSSVKIGGKVIIRESLTTFKCLFSNLHMF